MFGAVSGLDLVKAARPGPWGAGTSRARPPCFARLAAEGPVGAAVGDAGPAGGAAGSGCGTLPPHLACARPYT